MLLVRRARPVAADMDAILVLLGFEKRRWLLAELACYKREGAVEQRRCARAMRQARFGREACGSRNEARTSGHGVVRVVAVMGLLPRRRVDVPCPAWNKWGAAASLHCASARSLAQQAMRLAPAMHVMQGLRKAGSPA